MDTTGARFLAARLRARVGVGTTIRLERDAEALGLAAGDVGVVEDITPDGVLVAWDRGFRLWVDPEALVYRAMDAA